MSRSPSTLSITFLGEWPQVIRQVAEEATLETLGRSSIDILLTDTFTKLKIGGTILAHIQTSFYEFIDKCVRVASLICLPITISDGPEKAT
ncbi:hypothetical protein TIFTF001_016954 [Ficus carica]|uniref:Uncharacterized protein n=1 Tax=Ficus carica TaxID=3494 RepID=A0AA88A8E9_FICCA|nr:hypothetical protein TIFTF001_016954 [Ficus carica]